jgi:ferredoxin
MVDFAANSSKIQLDVMRCLRTDYYHNECSLCIRICPTGAIALGSNRRIALNEQSCIGCYGCMGVCPTSSFGSDVFDPDIFILRFSAGDEERLSCKSNTPCLSVFGVEQFISLGLRNKNIVCDLSSCKGCEFNQNGVIEASIRGYIEEANLFLGALGREVGSPIKIDQNGSFNLERRQLFGRLAREVSALQDDIDIGAVFKTDETIPVRRLFFQNSLKKVINQAAATTINHEFGFTAHKQIDFQSCTNCGDCVQFCPTKALTYTSDQSRILFQNMRCIGCGICDDICKPKSFFDIPQIDMVTMAFDRAEVLIEHRFVVCSECKTSFPQKSDEKICNRCKDFVSYSQDLFALARDI